MAQPAKCEPSVEEVALLKFVSEQRAVTVGQLGRFCGIYRSDARRIVDELAARRWLAVRRFIVDDDEWVWLRRAGSKLAGTGFSASTPSLLSLAHYRVVNEARLRVTAQASGGRWICEAELRRQRRRRLDGRLPDAVFEIDGERHAIEVELSRKPVDRLRVVIAQHSLQYDAVIYLCSRQVADYMQRVGLSDEFPLLVIRPLLDSVRDLCSDVITVGRDGSRFGRRCLSPREPYPAEMGALRFLAEQGLVPMDQLGRFLRGGAAATEMFASQLTEAGFVRRASPLVDEPDWLWLTPSGSRHSGTGLSRPEPRLGALPRLRALNEVRLQLADRLPGAQWVSGRALRRVSGSTGPRPGAVVEIDGERHAIDVVLIKTPIADLRRRVARRCDDYDLAVFYCAPVAYGRLSRLAASGRWPNLVVRRLSGSWRVGVGRRSAAVPVRRFDGNASRRPIVKVTIPPEDIPVPALAVLRDAHAPAWEPRVLSASRWVGRDPCYCVATDRGRWMVRLLKSGWKASKVEMPFVGPEICFASEAAYAASRGVPIPQWIRFWKFLSYAREHLGSTHTAYTYAAHFGISHWLARRDLRALVDLGLLRHQGGDGKGREGKVHTFYPVADLAERLQGLEI